MYCRPVNLVELADTVRIMLRGQVVILMVLTPEIPMDIVHALP